MLKVGITGQAGFIGTHLFNHLGLLDDIERVPFKDCFFDDKQKLQEFVSECDVIVHLAAMNRHSDPQVIYDTNIRLVCNLIEAMENRNVTPHVLFSSSTQEDSYNLYGASKQEGRRLLDEWSKRYKSKFTGLIVPNVFGPFGLPNYNSVVATFCHKVAHGDKPEIHVDGKLKLIYINDLCGEFISVIRGNVCDNPYRVPHRTEMKVSEILSLLNSYKSKYEEFCIIPPLSDSFEMALFNTFVCYLDHDTFFPRKLIPHSDERGSFVEILKLDNTGGQVSFSTTHPGITRGNHYHVRKFERFAVIKGKALIQLRKIGSHEVLSFELDGDKPSFVDMPIWYTHNITNIGDDDLYTIFWISERFAPNDPDTFFEKV